MPTQAVPVTENRCINCGSMGHRGRDCTAPGGGADPDHDTVWDSYRQRKAAVVQYGQASAPGGASKGRGKNKNKKDSRSPQAASSVQVGPPPART